MNRQAGLLGARLGEVGARSCRLPQRLLLVLGQVLHVRVAGAFEPVLVGLDRQRPHQQAAFRIGEDAHHMSAALQFLVQAFEHVGRLHMLVVLPRQPVVGERFLDILFDPIAQLGVLGLPFGEPSGSRWTSARSRRS